MRSIVRGLISGLLAAFQLTACGRGPELDFKVGGLYSIETGDGSSGVAKVLALDPGVVGVRVYKEKFEERPATVDPAALNLGSINDPDGFGMGHLPLDPDGFLAWKPVLISVQPVDEEELDGYRIWREEG